MKYTTKAAEKSTVKITLTFDKDEWIDAQNKAYVKERGRFAVNGFRKGKAPKNVIEHAYGKGVFYEDGLNILFSENYGKILDEKKDAFTVVGDPDVSVDELTEDKVVMSAVVPVKPEVKIEAYTGMKLKGYAYNVKDADVDAEIEKVLERNARKVTVEGRAAEKGDVANIDFVGTVDGVKFEGGEAQGFDLTLGSGQFIPGFEDQVIGMNVGEKKDVNVTFPEDYQAADLKGKAAVFAVTLNSLSAKEKPELTDAFIKDATGSETIEAYKEKTKERLQKQADSRANDDTENAILNEIAKGASAEIPQAMIESEIDNLVRRFEYQLMYQGLKLDDYLSFIKTTKEDFRKKLLRSREEERSQPADYLSDYQERENRRRRGRNQGEDRRAGGIRRQERGRIRKDDRSPSGGLYQKRHYHHQTVRFLKGEQRDDVFRRHGRSGGNDGKETRRQKDCRQKNRKSG